MNDMDKKIEKLERRYIGPDTGCGGATFSDVIDKINEIVDVLNGEQKECVADAGKTSGVLVWRKIKTGERLPCDAFICINGNYCCYMPNAKGVCVGGDGYYLPMTDLEKLPKEGEKSETPESEDERIRKWIIDEIKATHDYDSPTSRKEVDDALAWLEEQKEAPMPNSTELIEMWHDEKAMLKEKDFRGDEWRLAYNAFMDGFARGTCVKFEKQKEQKPKPNYCHYGGDPNIERCKHCSAACIGRLAEEQKPAEWSEDFEDSVNYEEEMANLCDGSMSLTSKDIARHFYELGRASAKPAEWSEEDEENRLAISKAIWEYDEFSQGDAIKLINWLKSLRPHWKPSEEQMLNLRYIISGCSYDIEPIVELEKQLKKLI